VDQEPGQLGKQGVWYSQATRPAQNADRLTGKESSRSALKKPSAPFIPLPRLLRLLEVLVKYAADLLVLAAKAARPRQHGRPSLRRLP